MSNKANNIKPLTITEADLVELAFQDAMDMGDTWDDGIQWAIDAVADERGNGPWLTAPAIVAEIHAIGEEVFGA